MHGDGGLGGHVRKTHMVYLSMIHSVLMSNQTPNYSSLVLCEVLFGIQLIKYINIKLK